MKTLNSKNSKCNLVLIVILILFYFIFIAYDKPLEYPYRLKMFSSNHTDDQDSLLVHITVKSVLVEKTLDSKINSKEVNSVQSQKSILVLMWTMYYGEDPLKYIGKRENGFYQMTECPLTNCKFTSDRQHLAFADGVVFHSRDMNRSDFPQVHESSQMWIFMLQESPKNTEDELGEYSNVFNWTMTYRQDSDIYHPYGEVLLKETTNWSNSLIKPLTKSKKVAWLVSHCTTHSSREKLVEKLKKYIQVDVYGKCPDDLKCPNQDEKNCFSNLAKSYKFYLAFENSLCIDYATEKFFNPLRHNIIPVVYGFANYTSIAPPFSYIDANNFTSVKALADYLIFLDRNDTEYLKYFEWKKYYRISSSRQNWCKLCQKLSQRDAEMKSYVDLQKWWYFIQSNDSEYQQYFSYNSNYIITNNFYPTCVRPEQFAPNIF